MPSNRRLRFAVVLGLIHLILQHGCYIIGFILGPGGTTRKVLGVSLYDVMGVITFPMVDLVEKLQWSGLGLAALFLNSILWSCCFYLILVIVRKP